MTFDKHKNMPSRQDGSYPLIVVVGLDSRLLLEHSVVYLNGALDSVRHIYDHGPIDILIIGPQYHPSEAYAALSRIKQDCPNSRTANIIVYGLDVSIDSFQDAVDEDLVFYLARRSVSTADLSLVVKAALKSQIDPPYEDIDGDCGTIGIHSDIDLISRLTLQRDLQSAAALLIDTIQDRLRGDRAQCVIHDPRTESLWYKNIPQGEEHRLCAVAGLIGFVALTQSGVRVDSIGADPRYDPIADDPDGNRESHFTAEAIIDPDGRLLAVIAVARNADSPPFSSMDADKLKSIAAHVSSLLSVLVLRHRLEEKAELFARNATDASGLFRIQALTLYARDSSFFGELLDQMPRYLKRAQNLVLLLSSLTIFYVLSARAHERLISPLLAPAPLLTVVTATSSGTISTITAIQGQRVNSGDSLAGIAGDLENIRSKRSLVEDVRASGSGVVTEVLVHPGQHVNVGETFARIESENVQNEVITLLPAKYASQVHPGLKMSIKISKPEESNTIAEVDSVALRNFDDHDETANVTTSDILKLHQSLPVVIVQAHLISKAIAGNRPHEQHGLEFIGEAELVIDSGPLILSFIPHSRNIINVQYFWLKLKRMTS